MIAEIFQTLTDFLADLKSVCLTGVVLVGIVVAFVFLSVKKKKRL